VKAYEFKVATAQQLRETDTVLADTPGGIWQYFKASIETADYWDPMKEHFVVVFLNTRRRVTGHSLVSIGQLDQCLASPREVFRPAIVAAAQAIVLVHNHPSGDPTPSEADIRITRDLIRAGQLLKIEIIDHVIAGETYKSLRELGFFYS
jgi:DNA repair protein RadC